MKNYRFIYCLGILLYLLCTSCHDFFKESSQDEIKPSSVEDLRGVMYKEAYPYQLATGTFLMLLTDEVQCNGLSNDTYATVHQSGTPVHLYRHILSRYYNDHIFQLHISYEVPVLYKPVLL